MLRLLGRPRRGWRLRHHVVLADRDRAASATVCGTSKPPGSDHVALAQGAASEASRAFGPTSRFRIMFRIGSSK